MLQVVAVGYCVIAGDNCATHTVRIVPLLGRVLLTTVQAACLRTPSVSQQYSVSHKMSLLCSFTFPACRGTPLHRSNLFITCPSTGNMLPMLVVSLTPSTLLVRLPVLDDERQDTFNTREDLNRYVVVCVPPGIMSTLAVAQSVVRQMGG